MNIRQLIADAINEDRNRSWYGCVTVSDITSVEVRKGCAEIDVHYTDGADSEYPQEECVTIDAAPILTALLQWAINTEEAE